MSFFYFNMGHLIKMIDRLEMPNIKVWRRLTKEEQDSLIFSHWISEVQS